MEGGGASWICSIIIMFTLLENAQVLINTNNFFAGKNSW